MSAGRGFERDAGDLLALVDHLVGGFDDRRTARHDRLRAAGAAAGDQEVAVALDQLDLVERDAELLGQHLGEGRPVALAVVERAGDDGDIAVGLEADAAHLLHRRRGDLEIVADAQPAQLAARLALGLARVEARDVGELQRLVEERGELAAVVGRARRRLEGHLLGLDVVALAHLDLVDAHLARRGVDQPLHEVVGLGPPGAAIGADRRGVGEGDLGRDLDQRRAVDGGEVAGDAHRAHQRADIGEVAADIGEAGEAHGQEPAVLVERQLGVEIVVAAVLVAQEAARALVGPLHRRPRIFEAWNRPAYSG